MAINATDPCTGTYGPMVPKRGSSLPITHLTNIFGKPIASYPPRAVLFDYIKGRAEKAAVRDLIRFSTIVRDVRALDGGGFDSGPVAMRWPISKVVNFSTKSIVATGHFSVPDVPECTGFDQFNGRILHAHDFREVTRVFGQRSFDPWNLLLCRGYRLTMLEIRRKIDHSIPSHRPHGL